MYAVSLRAQIKDGRIDELKEFIKNNVADEVIDLRCSKELMKQYVDYGGMGGDFFVSRCPLVTTPIRFMKNVPNEKVKRFYQEK